MKRILVTTDFSDNSIAGLRFAIQLATQAELELLFLHVPDLWSEVYRNPAQTALSDREKDDLTKRLDSFVSGIYDSMKIVPGQYQCVVHYHFGIVLSIINYAVNNNCEYICISTHGAGNIEKYLGTNTGELIRQSPIPVLCIPKNYISGPVGSVLYASDLTNYSEEIEKVVAFGKLVGAEVQVLHISSRQDDGTDKLICEELQKKPEHGIKFYYLKRDISKSLLEELDEVVARLHPSIVIMFTEQNRTFFEMLFLSSKTESYSFTTKVPLLSFNKT